MRNVIFILGLTLILISACDHPFSTRKPEKPNTNQSAWNPPHTPEDVLTNLIYAIQERNAGNYMRCFLNESSMSHVFHFEPDPEAAMLYPHLIEWAREQEENMIQETFSMVPKDSSLYMQFPVIVRDVVAADSATLVRQYYWVIHHDNPAVPSRFEGQAEIWLAESSAGEWGIYHWIDNAISDVPSISLWKAQFGGVQ